VNRKPLPKFRKGDVLKAADLNTVIAELERQRLTTGQNSGIALQETERGTVIRVASKGDRYLAIANGDITERDGATPGVGIVTLQACKRTSAGPPPAYTIYSLGRDFDVVNYSSTTGGIEDGAYVWIEQDINGLWFITSVDCG